MEAKTVTGVVKRRSLQFKIIRALLAVVVVYALLDHTAQRQILLPSFTSLQQDQARITIAETHAGIEERVEGLDRRTRALAGTRSAGRFLDGDDAWRTSTLEDDFLELQGLDLAYVVQSDGEVRWSALSDSLTDQNGNFADFPSGRLADWHPLLGRTGERPTVSSGIYPSEHGPLLVSSHPIADSGWLILGELLDGDALAAMVSTGASEVAAWTVGSPRIPVDLYDTVDRATSQVEPVIEWLNGDLIATLSVLEDVQGRPTILLRTVTSASVLATGRASVQYALLSAIAIGLTMLLVLQHLLGRVVISPLQLLTKRVTAITDQEDETVRLEIERDDEIGILANEFDSLLDQLMQSRSDLVTAARTAGMSEIATGVLHNIGNVLNSVVLSRELAVETVQDSQLPQLRKLVELLGEQANLATFVQEDPRGAKLIPFLTALTERLESERTSTLTELETLTEGVEHIRELVASQQALAGRSTVEETVSMEDQVRRAIEVSASASGARDDVAFDVALTPMAHFRVDRHKLLEILVNLIQNARQVLAQSGTRSPRIHIESRTEDQWLLLSVRDNGPGIEPENLARIFTHGFTTRSDGHGFGLHSSANSARQMGGDLAVQSDGPGTGATFLLRLPLSSPAAERTAA